MRTLRTIWKHTPARQMSGAPNRFPYYVKSLNMFSYGRGARERSEFYWLKASYFTLKFQAQFADWFAALRKALLLLRCDPALRNSARRTKQLRSRTIGFRLLTTFS